MMSRDDFVGGSDHGFVHRALIFVVTLLLLGTTLLNIAFSLAPQTMTAWLVGLLA